MLNKQTKTNIMKAKDLTPEIENNNEEFTEGVVLLVHPFDDEIYARVNINQDECKFDDIWSCGNFNEEEIKNIEFIAEKFFDVKAKENEPEPKLNPINPYEYFGVRQSDFF